MSQLSPLFALLLLDESGAITADWVVLTSGMILLGFMTGYILFNTGVIPLIGDVSDKATLALTNDPWQSTPRN